MDVLDWIEIAKKFRKEDLLERFSDAIIQDENTVDIQRQQWEADGADYRGRTIGFYKPLTEELSGGRKVAGTPWTLNDSGDFWANTYLQAIIKDGDLEFIYDSSGQHKEELFATIEKEWMGTYDPSDIFGLYSYYQESFTRLIEPKFVEQLKKYYKNV